MKLISNYPNRNQIMLPVETRALQQFSECAPNKAKNVVHTKVVVDRQD